MTVNELPQIRAVREKLEKIRGLLNSTPLDDTTAMDEWHACLKAMKEVVGNAHNDMNTIACLLAKDYLGRKLPMTPYDALAKAHGARGLDIDETTTAGHRVIGEIKTTGAFGHRDVRSPQKEAFEKDFARLHDADAEHKFFFVVDPEIFGIDRRKYAAQVRGLTVVLLPSGDEFTPL